jgi:hypothetical protein
LKRISLSFFSSTYFFSRKCDVAMEWDDVKSWVLCASALLKISIACWLNGFLSRLNRPGCSCQEKPLSYQMLLFYRRAEFFVLIKVSG